MSLLLLILLQTLSMTSEKPTLIYVGDPMCSWCYGISPELEKVIDHYSDNINFQLIVGGLRPYNTETMTDLREFLKEHWDDVNKASNQPFHYEILNRDDLTYDTEPPCRAVVVFREMYPELVFQFFTEVQYAFYYENMNMHEVATYISVLDKMGVKVGDFKERFESEKYKNKVKKDFDLTSELGVSSFPTFLLKKDGKMTRIANGYMRADRIISIIDSH